MRRTAKRVLGAGMLAAAAYAVWRALESRRSGSNVTWEPQPFPYPPKPHVAESDGSDDVARDTGERAPWVEPVDGACPATHPVKGKLSSGIFHVPGGANYERTRPDRCYREPTAAEADGLRAARA